ncbi:hypothetical protein CEUSTIGMA_g9171.t1 [Chlamydomonas eustigma]|uniref:DOMON domain-containing protein n=1 Tax=Chlamydomonas eustigma TaxID=1157962 RepID=A0A250XFB0_9CHLO|nr:hypothetical protein CEUSTIGMA_g9171.t1 [Chlamydomonas eustigma]|eukprot:GAX81743.1 hypothetical protein CEUSTIGMA_g9171.t1 [Chlamydomonas eustigma]
MNRPKFLKDFLFLHLFLELIATSFAINCNIYQSNSKGEYLANGAWETTALSNNAISGSNGTNPFFLCFSAFATYTYTDNSSIGFALLGGVPSDDLDWYNGVGGMLAGLYNQEDLHQYVFDYCRNSLAGAVVSARTNPNVLAPMQLNLDGGEIVNGTYLHPFPSYVSYVAGEEFLPAHPNPIAGTVQAWCCASDNCNTATTPAPTPPSSPPTPAFVSSGYRNTLTGATGHLNFMLMVTFLVSVLTTAALLGDDDVCLFQGHRL